MSNDQARFGYLLTAEQSDKVRILSAYMRTDPCLLIPQSIDRLWEAYLEATEEQAHGR